MGLVHILPSKLGIARLWRTIHKSSVPILLLHGVLPDADTSPFNSTGKFISTARLKRFLERIAGVFKVISLDDFVSAITGGRSLSNAMVVTFDDGYGNNFEHAMPLLYQMGIPFSVFVTTGFIDTDKILWNDLLEFAIFSTRRKTIPPGLLRESLPIESNEGKRVAISKLKETLKTRRLSEVEDEVARICVDLEVDLNSPRLKDVRFLTSEQIRQMADRGVAFGGHTVTHPILSRESQERVRHEVRTCRHALEKLTGQTIRCFAYPNGRRQDFNSMVIAELVAAGYEVALTSIHGLYFPDDSCFEVRRISVDNRWTYEEFETRCSGLLKAIAR